MTKPKGREIGGKARWENVTKGEIKNHMSNMGKKRWEGKTDKEKSEYMKKIRAVKVLTTKDL